MQDACAVVIIGISDHLKRAELGLYAIELVLAERIASVALYSCYDDTLTLSSINAAVEYLPEEKREEVLNKIIEHGIKMLT